MARPSEVQAQSGEGRCCSLLALYLPTAIKDHGLALITLSPAHRPAGCQLTGERHGLAFLLQWRIARCVVLVAIPVAALLSWRPGDGCRQRTARRGGGAGGKRPGAVQQRTPAATRQVALQCIGLSRVQDSVSCTTCRRRVPKMAACGAEWRPTS